MYIFSYEHKYEKDFKVLLENIKNIDPSKMDEESKTFKNIIDSLTSKHKDSDTDSNEDSKSGPSIPIPDLFNGVIGNLAKEIAEEIDPSKVNLDDPSKLLNSLMSGNLDENNDESGIFNLVKDISGKIQNKISSGDLNEEQLLSEAQNMMQSFSGNGKFPNLGKQFGGQGMDFNPMNMFNNMMKSGMMDNLHGDDKNIVDDAKNIINNKGYSGVTPHDLKRKSQLKSTRDRLKNKLNEKKKLLAEKERKKELKNKELVEEDIDLDALANEIEGM